MKTAIEWLVENTILQNNLLWEDKVKQAKEMEKEKHLNWNKFLESEKTLGISDGKRICTL